MANQGIKGIMLVNVPTTAERVAACRQRGLSLVCVDPSTTPPPADITTIAATNYRGGLQATQHLIGLGHRRIGMVCGAWGSVPNDERMAGYLIALSSAGIVHDPTLVAAGDFRYEGGLVAGRYLLSLDDPPTAIFAQSDEMAMGVYEAARRLGVSIPGELSVVGFDDGFAAQYSAPPLTTVRQPLEQMGATAVVALNDMLAHRVPHPMELETKLVVRASTATAPR